VGTLAAGENIGHGCPLFGATGRTGQYLAPQALEPGHDLTALVRRPSKLAIDDHRLTILQGDVTNADQVEEAVVGLVAYLED
jgi:putative NADH-flavin reductase